jgi:hypothetical protein
MRLPLLNAFEKKIGQSPVTQLHAPTLPSFNPAAFAYELFYIIIIIVKVSQTIIVSCTLLLEKS